MKMIETERLILRPLSIEDADDVFAWASDPVVNKYMSYPLHTHISQTQNWINSLSECNEFGFCRKDSGELVGAGSITYTEEFDAYELGYNLNKKCWKKGYATEAAKAMIQWAYQSRGARDFFARHANENRASGNVIRKCGFQFETFGQISKYDGSETFDASYYRLHLD